MRPEKQAMLNEIRGRVEESVFVIMTDYGSMNVEKAQALRSKLREVDAEFHIVKNRMFKHLADEVGGEQMKEGLTGRTAMVTGTGEVTDVARVLRDFIKANEVPTLKMGALEGVFLSESELKELADMPSKDEMRAKLVATLAAPMSQTVGVLNAKLSSLLYVLKAVEAKKADA
ncbi:50S ribosomal protein L10 [Kiritimatiellota bacterium B12222]|nr:50S ribosomal protein L10 [Kiritimatiellota bacterium B12222]